MGTYVNPGNLSMHSAVSSDVYIDKTGLLKVLNKQIGTEDRYFAVSRARRFGKSQACGMIDAYYSRGCQSGEMFAPFEIAKDPDFSTHLNKYNVLHFDVASFYNAAKKPEDILPLMDRTLLLEMLEEFPFLDESVCVNTAAAINAVYKHDKVPFVVVIDEYDCIIRDSAEDEELILQ